MSIPSPDLDDRRFQQLVDEAKRHIPDLVPEWTNHNVSDPGVALIELFAWMSEQVIYRLNQVPEKLHVEFLNLMGTHPFPASAARADLTFWLSTSVEGRVVVPAGTEVSNAAGSIVFATLEELAIGAPRLAAALTSRGESTHVDVWADLADATETVACFASEPVSPGDALLLGFEDSLARQMVDLTFEAAAVAIGVDPSAPPLVWEAWTGEHWVPVDVLSDTTGGLNRDGTVRLVVPRLHEPLVLGGQRRHWLRVRLLPTPFGEPTYQSSPEIRSVTAATRGGSVKAEHSRTVRGEVLGTSNGTAGQQFAMANRPVLPRVDGEGVVVVEDGREQPWTEVPDFASSGEDDLHLTIDEAMGVVRFGPRVRYPDRVSDPDGEGVQHGAVPPFGATVVVERYRTGGGRVGNVAPGILTRMRSTIPYVNRVSNLAAATGGVDAEQLDEVRVRGPRSLRAGRRAVTPSDYEVLARAASPRVARARCLPPEESGGPVRLLIVPSADTEPIDRVLDDLALDEDLYDVVSRYVDERRTIGARVLVGTPYITGVSVVVRVRAITGRSPDAVKDRVARALATYLDPLVGGTVGEGWGFGEALTAAGLSSMLEGVRGVGAVDELALFEYDLRNERRVGERLDTVPLTPDELLLAASPQVIVR